MGTHGSNRDGRTGLALELLGQLLALVLNDKGQ
jgi:hypothetical protein